MFIIISNIPTCFSMVSSEIAYKSIAQDSRSLNIKMLYMEPLNKLRYRINFACLRYTGDSRTSGQLATI